MVRTCKPACWRALFGALEWPTGPRVHWGCRRPSFGFLHPSLCASSLRRSLVLIHDNTDMQTHSHLAGISLHATQLHEDAQVLTPTLWPLWSHIPSPPAHLIWVLFHTGGIFSFMYRPFLLSVSVYIICCILALQSSTPPTHHQGYSFPDATSTLCRGGGGLCWSRGPRTQGAEDAGDRGRRRPRTQGAEDAGDRGRSDISALPLTSP